MIEILGGLAMMIAGELGPVAPMDELDRVEAPMVEECTQADWPCELWIGLVFLGDLKEPTDSNLIEHGTKTQHFETLGSCVDWVNSWYETRDVTWSTCEAINVRGENPWGKGETKRP
jgi:hypothetical protein